MNNANLEELEKANKAKQERHGLDSESIEVFKGKIKTVSDEERKNLGKQLFELISKRGYNDNFEKAIELIHAGANIEYRNETKGDFPLIVCARKGYFKTFLALIKAGANIDAKNNYETTTTMAAARHGQRDMLEILILLGADINACCIDGDNALISAKRHDQLECFNLLVSHNAYIRHRNLMDESIQEIRSSRPFDIEVYTSHPESVKLGVTTEEVNLLFDKAERELKKIIDE